MKYSLEATKLTAFLAGFSLGAAAGALEFAHVRGLTSFTMASPNAFPFAAAYFFVSSLLFVIGMPFVRGDAYERIPFSSVPKTKEGWSKVVAVWIRMVFWFGGAVVGGIIFYSLAAAGD